MQREKPYLLTYAPNHYENMPIQIYWNFTIFRNHTFGYLCAKPSTKKWKFSDKKKSDIFQVSSQNIDCGYSLEPPQWGGSSEYPQYMFLAEIRKVKYTPVNPSFTI